MEGAEWRGERVQTAINRMGHSTLGARSPIPRVILARESGLMPARALLNHLQARFTQLLYARLRNSDGSVDGPEAILTREN